MIKLSTPVKIPSFELSITPDMRGLIVGSCFATNIGERLFQAGLPVICNPQGVLYNPLSVARGVEILKNTEQFSADDLLFRDGLWHSFSHHGSFSAADSAEVLSRINTPINNHFDYIIITLGTAWIYERQGEAVANCHKFPEREFTRRKISIEETLIALGRIRKLYPSASILLTVSPIRHLRDGLSENSLSKATLRLAIDEFCGADSGAAYFPAYEIMIDELRDYRFYAQDMLHPSPLAIEIIFERFVDALLSEQAKEMVVQGLRRAQRESHRSLH